MLPYDYVQPFHNSHLQQLTVIPCQSPAFFFQSVHPQLLCLAFPCSNSFALFLLFVYLSMQDIYYWHSHIQYKQQCCWCVAVVNS